MYGNFQSSFLHRFLGGKYNPDLSYFKCECSCKRRPPLTKMENCKINQQHNISPQNLWSLTLNPDMNQPEIFCNPIL